jgi:ABC-type lipoprotein release transport system permease subunit
MIIKLAWRNIWRNWRRTAITIAAVFFAGLLSIAMRGLQKGTYENNIKNAVEMFTGYLQVQHKGYLENPSLRKCFEYDEALRNKLDTNKYVEAYTPRIIADGLVGYNQNSSGAAIFGLDPACEEDVSRIAGRVNNGKFLSDENIYYVDIGHKMLENMNAAIGDTIVILCQGYDGTLGNLKFKIAGTTKMGSPEMDAMSVFMHIDAADELLSMRGRINTVAINLAGLDHLTPAAKSLSRQLGDRLAVRDWAELMPDMKQSIEFDNVSGIVYLGLLIIIVAFGILNTVVMSISERTREFGIMLALGTRHWVIIAVTFFEIIFMALIGVIAGNVAGYFLNKYLIHNPIVISGDMAEMYEQFGFIPEMTSSVEPAIFFNTSITIMIIAFIVFIYPIVKVSKLEAIKGIRYT